MRIGVLGTGPVGRTIATRLVGLGHEVRMGSRSAGNEAATAWSAAQGEAATTALLAEFGWSPSTWSTAATSAAREPPRATS